MLHVAAGEGKTKKILCYKLDERVGNTEKILRLSLRTIKLRNANIDILHHMDKSLDRISAPLPFLQDKDPMRSEKKRRATGNGRDSRTFLMQQKRKRDRGNACAVLLASNSQVARDYAGRGAAEEADNLLHCVCEINEDDEWMIPSHTWNSTSPGELSPLDWKNVICTSKSYEKHEAHMSETRCLKKSLRNEPTVMK